MRILAEVIASLMEWGCAGMGHVSGCGLLNRRPTQRLYAWAMRTLYP